MEWAIAPIHKKGEKFSCENHKRISLITHQNRSVALLPAEYLASAKSVRVRIKLIFNPTAIGQVEFSFSEVLRT